MLTVSILINGQPLYTRSAVRTKGSKDKICIYECDNGSTIEHYYNDGAVVLAHKLLDTIKEPAQEQKLQERMEKLYKLLNSEKEKNL